MSFLAEYGRIKSVVRSAVNTQDIYLLAPADTEPGFPYIIITPLNSYDDTLNSRRREWAITLNSKPDASVYTTYADGIQTAIQKNLTQRGCLLYTSPSPRD